MDRYAVVDANSLKASCRNFFYVFVIIMHVCAEIYEAFIDHRVHECSLAVWTTTWRRARNENVCSLYVDATGGLSLHGTLAVGSSHIPLDKIILPKNSVASSNYISQLYTRVWFQVTQGSNS